MNGTIAQFNWTYQSSNCDRLTFWKFRLPDDHLVIFEGYSFQHPDSGLITFRYLFEDLGEYVTENTKRPVHQENIQDFVVNVNFQGLGSVFFRVNFHPINETPVEVGETGNVRGQPLYNCSWPYTVPLLWRCDMVRHCLGWEDEGEDCPYRASSTCGPLWTQFDQLCVHVVTRFGLEENTNQLCQDLDTGNVPVTEDRREQRAGAVQMPIVNDELKDFVVGVVKNVLKKPGNVHFPLKKVQTVSPKLAHLYRFLWQWGSQGSPIDYHQLTFAVENLMEDCALVIVSDLQTTETKTFRRCSDAWYSRLLTYVCVKPVARQVVTAGVHLAQPQNTDLRGLQTKTCPDGSLVQTFHTCPHGQAQRLLWPHTDLPAFPCDRGPPVHYTLVCDGVLDCLDGSDESRCSQADLSLGPAEIFACRSSEVIPSGQQCNGIPECFDSSDEEHCKSCNGGIFFCRSLGCLPDYVVSSWKYCPTPNFMLAMTGDTIPFLSFIAHDGYGFVDTLLFTDRDPNTPCNDTFFQCRAGPCIPTHVLNNGEQDCPLREDENIPTDQLTCPGHYRCYGSGSCVHPDYVCDGIPHCPNKDDERYCHLQCPHNCSCEGHAFTCHQNFDPLHFFHMRYLDLSGVESPRLENMHRVLFLKFLNLSRCGLTAVHLKHMPQLAVLDLSYNRLAALRSSRFDDLPGLLHLNLSGNPMTSLLEEDSRVFKTMASLWTLAVADTRIQVVASRAFFPLKQLSQLDLRGSPVNHVPQNLFAGLRSLRVLRADSDRLCCAYFHQDTDLQECDAPGDELSSCTDLLRSDFYRVCLWMFHLLAVTGNIGVTVYRLCLEQEGSSLTYRLFVVNLSLSDLLMGVYMAMVGVADTVFRDVYVSREAEWKDSAVCQAAGFIGFVSNEVSALAVCLITLDRMLVICFPFRHNLHFTRRSALAACGAIWSVGLILAAVPLLFNSWTFYGQSGICLPLPITRAPFTGQRYAFAVYVVLNLIIFVSIGAGQAVVLLVIRRSAQATMKDRRQQEVAIARQLFFIVFTDFCCWFPIGLMGLLASQGVPVPGLVNVVAAVLVLPINSAVNPFLYTLLKMLERREKRKMLIRVANMMKRLQQDLHSWPSENVHDLVEYCVRAKLVDRDLLISGHTDQE